MELRNVKTFIKVAELGNFSRASQELGYAQSTVTMQIQAIEKELNVTLFERNGKRITLSVAGQEFLEYAYDLQKLEDMAIEHFSMDTEPHGTIIVGVMETMCASHYGEIFKEFRKRYPKTVLKVIVAKTLDCMEMLSKGTVDVILTVDRKINQTGWICGHEIPTQISFFCSASHPFAGKEVELDDLLKENFIQIEEGCNYRQAFEQYLANIGKSADNVMEIGYTRLIIDAVASNLGVSLLPMFTLTDSLKQGTISTFSLKDYNIEMLMQVIYSEKRWMTPALKAFIELTREMLV